MYVHKYSCKVPVILVRFSGNLKFLDKFSNSSQILKYHEELTMGAEVINADGPT